MADNSNNGNNNANNWSSDETAWSAAETEQFHSDYDYAQPPQQAQQPAHKPQYQHAPETQQYQQPFQQPYGQPQYGTAGVGAPGGGAGAGGRGQSNTGLIALIIGLAAILVVLIGVIAYFFFSNSDDSATGTASSNTSVATEESTPPSAATITTTETATPTQASAPGSGLRVKADCGTINSAYWVGTESGTDTTCPFALNVARAIGERDAATSGSIQVTAYSPAVAANQQGRDPNIQMDCIPQRDANDDSYWYCWGGRNAGVYVYNHS